MKKCSICFQSKENACFYKKGLQCKDCQTKASIERYYENKDVILANHKVSRLNRKDKLREDNRHFKKKYASELHDLYIKNKLGISNAPAELIELKRLQLKLIRKINEK